MIKWLVNDWERDPINFTFEFLGALCFIVLSLYIAIAGNDTVILYIFIVQLMGSSLLIISSIKRMNVNILSINILGFLIASVGLIRITL
ncbi:MAG TPA: hypothetical protein EYQ45_03610 [Flavobacteriaceae bacterium]|jgi:hypothetical protein|nr:hypothetical protein [Flavobacteriaceae bacterium]